MNSTAHRLSDVEDHDDIERLFALARGDGPPAIDILQGLIDRARSMLSEPGRSTNERIRILWAAAKNARDAGAADVVCEAFVLLAVEVNLIDRNGRWTGNDVREDRRPFGAEDVKHVISWAWRGMNPFQTGPLK